MDIQAAIVIDSTYKTQISFEHIYIARVNPGGDSYGSSTNASTPCSRVPCQNNGFCVVITNTTYKCLCTAGWEGISIVIVDPFKFLVNIPC